MNVERLRRRDDGGGVRCGVVAVSENTAVSVGIPGVVNEEFVL
jgi:hypothetical protein